MSVTDPAANRLWAWSAGSVVLASAFLLFQIQPLISKTILPWFGGSPAVWTTCMLFFQSLLVAGYAYAHALVRARPERHAIVHLTFLAVAAAALVATSVGAWKPRGDEDPTWRILATLGATIGIPYIALASTGPLVQSWYQASTGRSPYRLYALSNVGSLAALLSYPILFEPLLDTGEQHRLWSAAFVVFAVGCGAVALTARRTRAGTSHGAPAEETPAAGRPAPGRWVLWLVLPALASLLLLAVTNHVCQDVAVVPLLWVVPLSLYLVTFIISFDRASWYRRHVFAGGAVAAIALTSLMSLDPIVRRWWLLPQLDAMIPRLIENVLLEMAAYFAVLFLAAMVCHGELYRLRPAARHLTSYYLMIAAGGALGGVFVAIVCPLVFTTYYEIQLGLMIAYALATVVLIGALLERKTLGVWWVGLPVAVLVSAGFVVTLKSQSVTGHSPDTLVVLRGFHGVFRVTEVGSWNPEIHQHRLYHGRILHGVQLVGPGRRRTPTSYYFATSGVAMAIDYYASDGPVRLGVVGLGAGTLAAFGRPGDYMHFYEISPIVKDLATDYFSFLSDCPADFEVTMGDARLNLERQPAQRFDILILDAFSGDGVPTHLLTREAFEVYRRHLRPGGTIIVNVANRHLEFDPVVAGLAESQRMRAVVVDTVGDSSLGGSTRGRWMLVTNNDGLLADPDIQPRMEPVPPPSSSRHRWTDQYSNIFSILMLQRKGAPR